MPKRSFALSALLGAALTGSRDARGSELGDQSAGSRPEPAYPFELGGGAAYATAPIRGGVNPFGAGFGARVGYVWSNVYFGATATYYLGGDDVGASDRALLFGTAVGYGLRLGKYLIVRPLLGVGDLVVSHTEPLSTVDVVTTASGSQRNSITTAVNNVYVEPGVKMLLASGAHFAAVGASALVVPNITYGPAPAQSTTWVSYSFEGDLGFRF
jgi:hypothetical protein